MIIASSTSLGTNDNNRDGSFFLGRPTFKVLNLLSPFSRMSRSVSVLHSTNKASFDRFLILLTPSCSALGSTASFISLFVSCDDVLESAALTISAWVVDGASLGCTTVRSSLGQLVIVPRDVAGCSLNKRALSSFAFNAFPSVLHKPTNMPVSLFSMQSISLTACMTSSFIVLSMLLPDFKACFTLLDVYRCPLLANFFRHLERLNIHCFLLQSY